MSSQLIIIAHNIRSTHNVGALFRTAEGLGISKLYLTGYTPYPTQDNDTRLPHIAQKLTAQIHKTALDAEQLVPWEQSNEINPIITKLQADGYSIVGLEQVPNSVSLPAFKAPDKLAIVLGSEVTGMDPDLISQMDYCLEIPMFGKKESFNVVEAATMVMYHCKLIDQI